MGGIVAALAEHAFEHLFIECLGWDRLRGSITATWKETTLELQVIAHKRGFVVLHCSTHRTVLANRRLLREIQRQVRRTYHEHIIIYSCETPRKQVWQWVIEQAGHRLRHREYPFFSNAPPKRLVERIEQLMIRLDEEERITLLDVLDRVRSALLPAPERNLFAKFPWYAARSDQLAMAVKRGEPGALQRFVEFHFRLTWFWARRLVRWFRMEYEDAQQTACIGLIEAARRFDPDRGYQFSTYAYYWMRNACQKYGVQCGLPLQIPVYKFWICYRLEFRETELLAAYGPDEARRRFELELEKAGITQDQWRRYQSARDWIRFSELDRRGRTELAQKRSTNSKPAIDEKLLRDAITAALSSLKPRTSYVIKCRYGFDQPDRSLQDIADSLGISKERVRQIQVKAEEKLRKILRTDNRLNEWLISDEKQTRSRMAQTLTVANS